MKTIEITLYKFQELSEDAKQTAIEKCRENENYLNYEWYDGIYEDFKTIAGLMGVTIDNIYWSGFYSQGDGACFEGSYQYEKGSVKAVKEYAPVDVELHSIVERLQAIQKRNFYGVLAYIKHSGHYYHANCTNINVEHNYNSVSISGDTEDEVIICLRDLMRWLYAKLESEFDYLNTDESIAEHLEANEYEFEAGGSRY